MMMRRSVTRCLQQTAARSASAMASTTGTSSRSVPMLLSASARSTRSVTVVPAPVRHCSSSRFLSLADDDEDGGKQADGGDDEEGGADGEEPTGEDGDAAGEEGEKDGDLVLEDEMFSFCVSETEELDVKMMELYMENPTKWTPLRLARRFSLPKQRVEAAIHLQAEEAGLTPEEFRAKVEDVKKLVAEQEAADAASLAAAQARGDEKEVARLQKRARQLQRDVEEVDSEERTEEEEAMILGNDEETYRNPDFFFLSDEFEGYPPLTRRLGKHKATDKLYPEEAMEIQRLAANKTITPLKSFAKPTSKANRWKIAVKDTSKIKLPLLVRTEARDLRLANKEEVMPRTWVRRPAYFGGLDASDF